MYRYILIGLVFCLTSACSNDSDVADEWSKANDEFRKKHAHVVDQPNDLKFGEDRALYFALVKRSRSDLLKLLKNNKKFRRAKNLTRAVEMALVYEDYDLFAQLIRDPNALQVSLKGEKRLIDIYLNQWMASNRYSMMIAEQIASRPQLYRPYLKKYAFFLATQKNAPPDLLLNLIKAGLDLNQVDEQGNTLLIIAARHVNVAFASRIIKLGGDVYHRNKLDMTALMVAAREGNFQLFSHLIDAGSDLEATSVCTFEKTLLPAGKIKLKPVKTVDIAKCITNVALYAVLGGNLKIVSTYFKRRAYFTHYRFANGNGALATAVRKNKPELVNYLLALDVNANEVNPVRQMFVLSIALSQIKSTTMSTSLHAIELANLLVLQGADVNAQKANIYSPLAAAINHCNVVAYDYLQKKGALLDAVKLNDFLLFSDWHVQRCNNPLALFRRLQKSGLSLSIKEKSGKNLVHFSIEAGHYDLLNYLLKQGLKPGKYQFPGSVNLLHFVSLQLWKSRLVKQYRYYQIAALLLEKNLISANTKDKAGVPLLFRFLIAPAGHYESERNAVFRQRLLHTFVKKGYKLFQRDANGNQVLHALLKSRFYTFREFRYWIEHGSSVNASGEFGKSPVHFLIESTNYDKKYYQLLRDKNANLVKKDINGQTALHYVLERSDQLEQADIAVIAAKLLPAYQRSGVLKTDNSYLIDYLKKQGANDHFLLQTLVNAGLKLKPPAHGFLSLLEMARHKKKTVRHLLGFYLYHQNKPPGSFNAVASSYLSAGTQIDNINKSGFSFKSGHERLGPVVVQITGTGQALIRIRAVLHQSDQKNLEPLLARMLTHVSVINNENNNLQHWLKQNGQKVFNRRQTKIFKNYSATLYLKPVNHRGSIQNLIFEVSFSDPPIPLKQSAQQNWQHFIFEDGDSFYGEAIKHNNQLIPHGKGICMHGQVQIACEYIKGKREEVKEIIKSGWRYSGKVLVDHAMYSRNFYKHGSGSLMSVAGNRYQGVWSQDKLIELLIKNSSQQIIFKPSGSMLFRAGLYSGEGECSMAAKTKHCRLVNSWPLAAGQTATRATVNTVFFQQGRIYNESLLISKLISNSKRGLWYSNHASYPGFSQLYLGVWQDGKPHGKGIYIDHLLNRYEGQWHYGRPHGHGNCLTKFGEQFKCHYYQDFFSSWVKSSGNLSKAVEQLNLYLQQARLNGRLFPLLIPAAVNKVAAYYQGKLTAGFFHGQGKLVSVSLKSRFGLMNPGDFYQGEFKAGLMHGQGSYHFRIQEGLLGGGLLVKKTVEGKFDQGQWPVKGMVSWQNGAQYRGRLKQGMADGIGFCRELVSDKIGKAVQQGARPVYLEPAEAHSCHLKNDKKYIKKPKRHKFFLPDMNQNYGP